MIDIENMGQDSLNSLSQEHLSEEEKSGIEKISRELQLP